IVFFFSSRRRHTRFSRDWSSDVCSSDLSQLNREGSDMARCTAPSRGHRTASGAAACPACGGRSRGYGYSTYSPPYYPSGSSGGGRISGGGGGSSSGTARPRWSRAGSSVVYTPAEVRTLTPIRESFERRATAPELRDVFLCHAWDDRKEAAKE